MKKNRLRTRGGAPDYGALFRSAMAEVAEEDRAWAWGVVLPIAERAIGLPPTGLVDAEIFAVQELLGKPPFSCAGCSEATSEVGAVAPERTAAVVLCPLCQQCERCAREDSAYRAAIDERVLRSLSARKSSS
jgi:hypothetical protein